MSDTDGKTYILTLEHLTYLYNIAYNSGHNDTVEACDTPAHYRDMDTYRSEVVEELLDDICIAGEG